MTREEAINELSVIHERLSHPEDCEQGVYSFRDGEYLEALDMAIKALEQKWIPVSERLPEESITVIGITTFDDIYKAELYDDCGEKKWYADGNFDVPIVAWMPLPEPYKAESEENDDMEAMLEHLWNVEVCSRNFIQLKQDVLNNKQLWRKLREIEDEDSD